MPKFFFAIFLISFVFFNTLPAYADSNAIIIDNSQIKWQDAPSDFEKGIKISYVYGNPSNSGPFVIRIWMPPHSNIAPHIHSMDETLTVISGKFIHYVGNSFDKAKNKELTSGAFVHLSKNTPHALRTNESDSIFEVVGVGPFGMTYINPKDDPSH